MQEGGIKGFLKRAKANLHCVLCLRTAAGWHRLRQQLPGLDASAFTMHIAPWSQAALQHIASKHILRLPLGSKQSSSAQASLAALCQLMHTSAAAELQALPSSAPRWVVHQQLALGPTHCRSSRQLSRSHCPGRALKPVQAVGCTQGAHWR